MSANDRNKTKRDHDRIMVERLRIRGLSFREIAKKIDISESTVRRDEKAVRKGWRARREEILDEIVAETLAEIREVKREAWAMVEAGKDEKGLELVLKALRDLRKLLGTDKPSRLEVDATEGGVLAGLLRQEEALLVEEVERLRALNEAARDKQSEAKE